MWSCERFWRATMAKLLAAPSGSSIRSSMSTISNANLPSWDFAFPLDDDLYEVMVELMRQLRGYGFNTQSVLPQMLPASPNSVTARAHFAGTSDDGRNRWLLDVQLFRRMERVEAGTYDDVRAEITLVNEAPDPPHEPSVSGWRPVGSPARISYECLVEGAAGMSKGLFLDAASKALVFVKSRTVDHGQHESH
jgi:hypothetical protein